MKGKALKAEAVREAGRVIRRVSTGDLAVKASALTDEAKKKSSEWLQAKKDSWSIPALSLQNAGIYHSPIVSFCQGRTLPKHLLQPTLMSASATSVAQLGLWPHAAHLSVRLGTQNVMTVGWVGEMVTATH